MNACEGCGAVFPDEDPTPSHCRNCPPTRCEDCGGICDWHSGALCSCWTDLTTMPLADVKAMFAADADCDGCPDCQGTAFSIDTGGGPSVTGAETKP